MLSVVIATHESERALLPTLAALIPGAAAGAVREVIVADGGSRDQTADVADIAGCRIIVSQAPLGERLKDAAAAARSPWLMFLRPGIVPDPTWISEVIGFVEAQGRGGLGDARAAVFRQAPAAGSARPAWVEVLALIRMAFAGPGPEQGLIMTRQLYDSLGGHRADTADPEADFLRRMGRRRVGVLRTSAGRAADPYN
jgi:glycosyltransferase involved in cell wall biosynthesis